MVRVDAYRVASAIKPSSDAVDYETTSEHFSTAFEDAADFNTPVTADSTSEEVFAILCADASSISSIIDLLVGMLRTLIEESVAIVLHVKDPSAREAARVVTRVAE